MVEDSGKIVIFNENNEEIECDVLFTFDNTENNKSYIVYTDNTKDELGNTRVYANTIDDENEGTLGDIDDGDWELIEQIFSSINEKKDGE